MTLQRTQLLGRLEEPAVALTHTRRAQTPESQQSRPEAPAEPVSTLLCDLRQVASPLWA